MIYKIIDIIIKNIKYFFFVFEIVIMNGDVVGFRVNIIIIIYIWNEE